MYTDLDIMHSINMPQVCEKFLRHFFIQLLKLSAKLSVNKDEEGDKYFTVYTVYFNFNILF